MDHDLGHIAGEDPWYPEHAIESWPEHPVPANELQWQATRQRFVELLAWLATLADSESATLDRIVEDVGAANVPMRSTVHARLWQISAHNSYHAGQIALLRRQAGAWPPEGGGDTW
jgi:uncharacterized damage-inducible protein DinB